MSRESRFYDLSRPELEQGINSVEDDEMYEVYRRILKTTGFLASFCEGCENEKIYVPSEEEYYCPVCS